MIKGFHTGKLDRKIEIWHTVKSTNDIGEEVETWEQKACVWTWQVDQESVVDNLDFIESKQVVVSSLTSWVIRRRAGITTKDEIRRNGKRYRIVKEPEEFIRQGLIRLTTMIKDNV